MLYGALVVTLRTCYGAILIVVLLLLLLLYYEATNRALQLMLTCSVLCDRW